MHQSYYFSQYDEKQFLGSSKTSWDALRAFLGPVCIGECFFPVFAVIWKRKHLYLMKSCTGRLKTSVTAFHKNKENLRPLELWVANLILTRHSCICFEATFSQMGCIFWGGDQWATIMSFTRVHFSMVSFKIILTWWAFLINVYGGKPWQESLGKKVRRKEVCVWIWGRLRKTWKWGDNALMTE